MARCRRRAHVGSSIDGGEPEPARDRYAEHGGGQQHEPKIQKAKFAVLHDGIPRWSRARASAIVFGRSMPVAHTALACARVLL